MSVFVVRRVEWRQALVSVHRWMGIGGGLLFLAWFASGVVMMYARMPELPRDEVLARMPPLDLSAARVTVATAARGGPLDRLRVTMLLGRPVYHVTVGRATTALFADTATPVDVAADDALAIVRAFAPDHAATIRHDALLTEPDQWTLGVRTQLPLHRVALGDDADTYFYVARASGELVMRTTARDRFWGYAGAVVHWLYFTPFRRQTALWNQSIVWLAGAGSVLCLTGLLWGVLVVRKSPYSGLMKWHHYSGLVFGATTLTFVFSGLLSMGPFWSTGTAPTRAQRERVAGARFPLETVGIAELRQLAAGCKELEPRVFRGALIAPCEGAAPLANEVVEQAAREAMPDAAITESTWLRVYDNYYYARDTQPALPVLRVKYDDADRTWLYLDPRRGTIVRREDRRTRVERWLYHGLHSWDFPFLYRRRPLWDVVMIALSVGGLVLSATTLVPGWRRLRRVLTSRLSLSPRRSSSGR